MTAETRNARGEWPERYACNGPEGTFWTDDAALANKLIGAAFDRDEWTVTDTQNPTGAAPSSTAETSNARELVAKLAAHVRPTCSELWAEAQAFLAADGVQAGEVSAYDLAVLDDAAETLDRIGEGSAGLREARARIASALSQQPEAQCGGEVAAWETEDGRVISARQKATALRDGGASASSVAPYTTPLYRTAPPSAPVGVEAIAAEIRASLGRGATVCTRRRWAIELEALAQQPAAVDGAMAERLADAVKGEPGWSCLNPQARIEKARRYLALAAQHQEPKS